MADTATTATSDDVLWDPNDVARYLKVSRSWVYQKACSGKLPVLRIEGLLRFQPERIKAYALGERPAGATVTPIRRPRKPREPGTIPSAEE